MLEKCIFYLTNIFVELCVCLHLYSFLSLFYFAYILSFHLFWCVFDLGIWELK